MRFGVLGPLSVGEAGAPVPIGGRSDRVVLCALLAWSGETVSGDRLIDAVWGAAPPRSATKGLQNVVMRLRKVLGPGLIETRPDGYCLRVRHEAIDVWRFEELSRLGRGSVAVEEWDAARAALAEAVARWRGPALVDLADWSPGRSEAARLDELRRGIEEDLVDVELAMGHHQQVVARIQGLVVEEPLRERRWAQLMLALYRCGQQADAMRAFQRARDALDEVGLLPGPALIDLEQLVSTRNEVLELARVAPTESAAMRDRLGNLPRQYVELIGRDADVERVATMVVAGQLVTLIGPGGVGKTSLAKAAATAATGYADGTWWVELAATSSPADVCGAVASALGLVITAERPDGEAIANVLRHQQRLIVLDNCEHVLEPVSSLVQKILDKSGEVGVLATSREALGCRGERVVSVEPLSLSTSNGPSDAHRLFHARLDASGRGVVLDANDLLDVEDICTHLDGLPLAIELAAAHAAVLGLQEVRKLVAERPTVSARRRGDPRHHSLAAVVAWSYERLTDVERVVFDRLAVFADGFDLPAATTVCTAPPLDGGVEQIIVSLVDKSLVTVEHTRPVRYRQLEVVRRFAADRLEARGEAASMFDRAVAHFVGWLTVADQGVRGPDEWSWHPRIDREWANLRSVFARAVAVGNVDAATAIVCRAYVWATQHERMELGEWADTLRFAPGATEHPDYPIVLAVAADYARRRLDMSMYFTLVEKAQQVEREQGRAHEPWPAYVGFWAEVSYQTLDPSPAAATIDEHAPRDGVWDVIGAWCDGFVPALRCSLATAAAPPDPDDTARVRRCLALAERHGNPSLIAKAQHLLGRSLRQTEPDTAIDLLTRSLDVAQALGNEDIVSYDRGDLGIVLADVGRIDDAATVLRDGMENYQRAGDVNHQWNMCMSSLRVLAAKGADRAAGLMLGRLTNNPPAPLWRRIYLVERTEAWLASRVGSDAVQEFKQEALRVGRQPVVDEVLTALQPDTPASR